MKREIIESRISLDDLFKKAKNEYGELYCRFSIQSIENDIWLVGHQHISYEADFEELLEKII
jgi:hypothetical protein